MTPFLKLTTHKSKKTTHFPKIKCFVMSSPTPLYMLCTWKLSHDQNNVIKNKVVIENVLGKTLRTWETLWEPDGNTLGTWWEHIRNRQKTNPCPHKTQKKVTKPGAFIIGCMKFLFPTHLFQPGLISTEGTYYVILSSQMHFSWIEKLNFIFNTLDGEKCTNF
jgi:hypothetical protein